MIKPDPLGLITEKTYASLFPKHCEKEARRLWNIRYSGAPEWVYVLQDAAGLLRELLGDLAALWVAHNTLKALVATIERDYIVEIWSRVRHDEICQYRRIVRRMKRATVDGATKAARDIAKRHGDIVELLKTRTGRREILAIVEPWAIRKRSRKNV